MESIGRLARKAANILESGADVQSVFPILEHITPWLKDLYGKHTFPTIVMQVDDYGYYFLWTTIPEIDFTHEASWHNSKPLSIEEQDEIREHLLLVLRAWINEDEQYSEPMEMQDAVRLLQIGMKPTQRPKMESRVKTLNRAIAAGTIRAIKLNKNRVRILRADIPE